MCRLYADVATHSTCEDHQVELPKTLPAFQARGLTQECSAVGESTLITCALQSTCMRRMFPVDAKCRISVMAWRRSPSAISPTALAFAFSALNTFPPRFCRSFCTSSWPPLTASYTEHMKVDSKPLPFALLRVFKGHVLCKVGSDCTTRRLQTLM